MTGKQDSYMCAGDQDATVNERPKEVGEDVVVVLVVKGGVEVRG